MSSFELVICSLRSYLNTDGCCGQVILLGDTWLSELRMGTTMPMILRYFQSVEGFHSRNNPKGGGSGGLSFTGLYVLHTADTLCMPEVHVPITGVWLQVCILQCLNSDQDGVFEVSFLIIFIHCALTREHGFSSYELRR